jgi:hypothetical protein
MRTRTQVAGILGVAMLAACAGDGGPQVERAASHEATHVAPEETNEADEEPAAARLSRDEIQAVIRASQRQLQHCYEKELVRDPELAGRVKLEFTVEPDGSVSDLHAASSSIDSDEVVACVRGIAREWRFPERSGQTHIAYPFNFTAVVSDPPAEFWAHLEALCGKAFAGELVEGTEEGDQALAGVRLVIDAHTCEDDEIRIGFHAGEDRSRTWVFRRGEGLSLAHDHRDPDGTPHEVTGYGGPTRDRGEPTMQEFFADAHTAEVAPEAATNVWTLRIEPGERLTYSLRRRVGDRRFRADFDLSAEVDAEAR